MNSLPLTESAQIALAAYADLVAGTPRADQERSLRDDGFADTQAQQFLDRYEIVTQYADDASLREGNGTSLSVTVFRHRSTGQWTVAIRGTAEPNDWPSGNFGIIGGGAAYPQIAALYNWWLRANAADGTTVPQYRVVQDSTGHPDALAVHGGYLVRIDDASATGELRRAGPADPDGRVAVTGHSLGGHLAMAFGALFPTLTESVTAFNAPGFRDSTTNQQFFARLAGPGTAIPLPGDAKITNVIADGVRQEDVSSSPIAGLWSEPGTVVRVPIEDQWLAGEPETPPSLNHSQLVLADALAVWHVLDRLQPGLSMAQFDNLLQQASNREHESLESLIAPFRQLMGVGAGALPTGNGAARESLYQALKSIEESPAFSSLAGRVRLIGVQPVGNNLATQAQARVDFQTFVALQTLSPFVVDPVGASGEAALQALWQSPAWATTYTMWQQDKAAVVAGQEPPNFSNRWLADRAALVTKLIERNDRNLDPMATATSPHQGRNVLFLDLESDLRVAAGALPSMAGNYDVIAFGKSTENLAGELTGHDRGNDALYGMAGNDTVIGLGGHDHLEGNSGNDSLSGGAGNDVLLGGTGNDTLDGGADADQLHGGEGIDRYQFSGQWAHDTIVDPQGDGEIWVGSMALHTLALTRTATHTWQSADRQITVTRSVASGPGDLVIQVAGSAHAGTITVRNWSDGQLGIQLGGQVPAPATGGTLVGDFNQPVGRGLPTLVASI